MKRIISLILAVLLLCPTFAMADATKAPKKDYYAKKSATAVSSNKYAKQDNDIMLYTFADVAPGSLPGGIAGSGNYGSVTTELIDVDGMQKNCLVIEDTDPGDSSNGVTGTIALGGKSGRIGLEYRMKYIPDEKSGWVNYTMDFYGDKGYYSRFMIHSSTGVLRFNNTGNHNMGFEKIQPDAWYTIKYIIDTDKKIVEAVFINEATDKRMSAYETEPLNDGKILNNIKFQTLKYGGKLVFDYIRVTEEEDLLSEAEDRSIQKGRPQIRKAAPVAKPVAGRINVMVDGEYKYTTQKPYVSANGNVMVTAKNLALMFGLEYSREGSVYTIANDKTTIVIDMTSGTCEANGKKAALKEAAAENGVQLFVPVESVATILGAAYEYDEASELVTITTKGGNK